MAEINKDIIYTSSIGANVPLPQHEKADGQMALSGENNPLPSANYVQSPSGIYIPQKGNADGDANVNLNSSNIMLGVDIQSRYATTIQTHNAVTIAASGYSTGAWIDAGNFDKVAVTLVNDAQTTSAVNVAWSHDGSVVHANENNILSGTNNQKTAITDVKARYFRLVVTNGDTASHIMSAWAYLKA